jgi:hypothetical protein
MTRSRFFIINCVFLCFGLFAEQSGSVGSVNTAAAIRSLERASLLLGTSDWQQAEFEARLGSTYDPTIADFPYIEALSLAASGSPRADVLERLTVSLSTGLIWRSYSKDEALTLTARLLVETCDYSSALSFLSKLKNPVSADADCVKLMAYYGLGQTLNARNLVSLALDRWPFDGRFPKVFLSREAALKPNELSTRLASTILSRLYVWDNDDRSLLLLAVPFETDPAQRDRYIREYRNMGSVDVTSIANSFETSTQPPVTQSDPASSIFALEYGVIDESAATDEIFSGSKDGISLKNLISLCKLTGSASVRLRILTFLSSFDGVIIDDANSDGIIESRVQYRLGRPVLAIFDRNQDGYPDYTVSCDLGAPMTIVGAKDESLVTYDTYPNVRSVKIGAREYTMKPLTLSWSPVAWVRQDFRLDGKDFFTIKLTNNETRLTERLLVSSSTFYSEPDTDRPQALRRVTLDSGVPVSSESRENGMIYSKTMYRRGFPQSSLTDRDGDGYFETTELYTQMGKLSSIMVDRNANRVVEYREDYANDGSMKQSWDGDENGVAEISRFADKTGTDRLEWIHPSTGRPVVLFFENNQPRSVQYAGMTLSIIKDPLSSLWWIGKIPSRSREIVKILENTFNPDDITVVTSIITVDNTRINAVRTGGMLFAELLDE